MEVNFALALALKNSGFDENCVRGYDATRGNRLKSPTSTKHFGKYCSSNKHIIKAPTYDQVIDWLREKHNTVLWISYEGITEEEGLLYTWNIASPYMESFKDDELKSNNYRNELDYGILKCLNIIPQNND